MGLESIEIFARSMVAGLAASITVGPVAVLCIQRTLSKSYHSGLISGLGVALADTLMAVVAYFFYAMLQSQIDQYFGILSTLGGILVIVVGASIFFKNPVPQIRRNRAGHSSPWQDFISVFGLTLANFIMVIPYLLAFLAVFKISSSGESFSREGLMHGTTVMGGFFTGAIAWWSALATLINSVRHRFRPRHMLTLNHVAGIVIGLLGVYTIISTLIQNIQHGA
ncbi:MAG: LysE family transporter [Rikenellaceae bacterium]